jgi:thiol-disulfide isomerase/thioredoxin
MPAFGSTNMQEPADKTVPKINDEPLRSLPEGVRNAQLKSVRGDYFRLSDYSGKVLVVNLWATWCGPCKFETPALVKLQREFRSQGVRVVELSTENPKNSKADLRRWVRRFRVSYRVGWAPPKVALTLMNGQDAIPQTFIVSKTGRIVRRFIGWNAVDTVPRWRLAIREAIDGE